MKARKLIGERIFLGTISKKDISLIVKWMNDLEVVKYTCHAVVKHNEHSVKRYLEKVQKDKSIHYYGIFLKNGKLIGSINLRDVDSMQRTAGLGIIIGEKKYWSNGYGTEAIRLMLDYGFNYLNLNNIMLEVFDFNVRALKCYDKAGFKFIGRRRKSRFFGGKYYDDIFMDILADDFWKQKIDTERSLE